MAKRISYKIIDPAALESAYPELFYEETIVKKKIHTDKLYKIVKLHNELGRAVDGVHIGTDDEYWGNLATEAEKEGYIGVEESEKFINEKLAEVTPVFLKGKE